MSVAVIQRHLRGAEEQHAWEQPSLAVWRSATASSNEIGMLASRMSLDHSSANYLSETEY